MRSPQSDTQEVAPGVVATVVIITVIKYRGHPVALGLLTYNSALPPPPQEVLYKNPPPPCSPPPH